MDTDHGVILWEEKPFCLRRPRTFCAKRSGAACCCLCEYKVRVRVRRFDTRIVPGCPCLFAFIPHEAERGLLRLLRFVNWILPWSPDILGVDS